MKYLALLLGTHFLLILSIHAQNLDKSVDYRPGNTMSSPNLVDVEGNRIGEWTLFFTEEWAEVKKSDNYSYYRIINYQDGNPVGKVVDYYANGIKQWEGVLVSENPEIIEGEALWYDENGVIADLKFFKNGVLDDDETIRRLKKIVDVQFELDGSLPAFQKPVLALINLFGTDHFERIDSLLHHILSIQKRKLGDGSLNYINSLAEVASWYEQIGRYSNANELRKEILVLSKREFGSRHLNTAYVMYDLAVSHFYLGEYSKAEPLYAEAISIQRELLGKEHPHYANSLNGLAVLYYSQGNYEMAESLYLEAKLIYKSKLGELSQEYAYSLNALGVLYNEQRLYDKSEPLYREALAIRKQILGEDHPDYAYSVSNLSEMFFSQGKYEEALKLATEALALNKKILGEHHPNYALTVTALGIINQSQGQYESAKAYYKQALKIYKESLGVNHPTYVKTENNLAQLYYKIGEKNAAKEIFLRNKKYYLDYLKNMFEVLGEQERDLFYGTLTDYFETFKSYSIAESFESPELLAELYDLQLATKSILLNTSNKIKRQILQSSDRVLIELYNHVQKLKQEIGLNQYSLENNEELIDSLKVVLSTKDKELSDYASFYSSKEIDYKWQDIKAVLKKNESAIEIIRVKKRDFQKRNWTDSVMYAALIINSKTKDYPHLVLLQNGNEMEGRIFEFYKNSITHKTDDLESFKNFWQPIASYIGGSSTTYFSADGVYNSINLGTLFNSKKGNYLFEQMDIHMVTNTRDLLKPELPEMPYNYAILIGDPDFRTNSDADISIRNSKKDRLSDFDRNTISPLPGTRKEIDILSTLFTQNNWKQDVWVQKEATEINLKKMVKPKVLHIATHGFFTPDKEKKTYNNNSLSRSGLILAVGNSQQDSNDEDGILTAFEAMNLNIENTELVVLSACETGLGDIRNGEGVYGLQRAFYVGGARSLMISLWKVDDEVTQELMSDFYFNWLGGMSKHNALNTAQSKLKEKYTSPYYWGAFVLVGDQ